MKIKLSTQNLIFLQNEISRESFDATIEYLILDWIKFPDHPYYYIPCNLFNFYNININIHSNIYNIIYNIYRQYYITKDIEINKFTIFLSSIVNYGMVKYKRNCYNTNQEMVQIHYSRKYKKLVSEYGLTRLCKWAAVVDHPRDIGFSRNYAVNSSANIRETWQMPRHNIIENTYKLNALLFKLNRNKELKDRDDIFYRYKEQSRADKFTHETK